MHLQARTCRRRKLPRAANLKGLHSIPRRYRTKDVQIAILKDHRIFISYLVEPSYVNDLVAGNPSFKQAIYRTRRPAVD
jgi:hypothetical protein